MAADTVVRGGDVVVGGAVVRADVAVTQGRITAVSAEPLDAARVVDARGCLVLPGGVDGHVHLATPDTDGSSPGWVDDLGSGTRAAAAGGITTVGNMTFPRPGEGLAEVCRRVEAQVRAQAVVDVLLHPVVSETRHLDPGELTALLDLGQTSVKVFVPTRWYEQHRQEHYRFLAEAGRRGFLTVVHCEDGELVDHCTAVLAGRGEADVAHFGESRPVAAEEAAVVQVIAFAEATGTPVCIVHLSSRRALEACTRARARGVPVHVETRPLYLHLTEEVLAAPDGARYVGQPPLRSADDVDALWAGLRYGTVDTVASDHAPWTLEQKLEVGHSLAQLRPGVADLETLRPMLFSAGVVTGRLSLPRFVEVTATNPARLLGLHPRKGVIAPGADADLVVWDPDEERVVDGSRGQSRAGYSPYDGTVVRGWPRHVLSHGEPVVRDGEVVGGPAGRGLLQREATQPW